MEVAVVEVTLTLGWPGTAGSRKRPHARTMYVHMYVHNNYTCIYNMYIYDVYIE